MKPIHKLQSGMSIVEVIMTLAIVLLIAALYVAAANTVSLTRESDNQEIALRVAGNEIDALRKGGYAAVPASGSFSSSGLSSLPGGSGTLTVTNFSATVKQITVTVQWNEPRSSTAQTVSLTTAVANTGGL